MQFALQTSGTYDRVLAGARWAEANGLVAFALPDHYLMAQDEEKFGEVPAPDALIQLAGLARETTSIELSVLVSPITFRHPAVLAKSAIELSIMSGGRFTLGVGTGSGGGGVPIVAAKVQSASAPLQQPMPVA